MAISILTAEGLTKLLQKIKAVFATKSELNAVENSIANEIASQVSTIGTDFVHKTGNETIAGDKTFSTKINVASNTLLSSQLTGISNADETRSASTKKLILELKDKNSKRFFGIESEAATNGSRRIYFHLQKRSNDAWVDGYQFKELADGTIQNIVSTPPASANDTQIATTAFVKAQGYITSSDNITGSSGSCTGNAVNVTGTVAIANGGTGATTRLNAIKALTNENVSTNATHFLGLKSDWSKVGYISASDAKTVLGLKSAAYTESSEYATSGHTHSYLPLAGGSPTGAITSSSYYTGSGFYVKNASVTKGTNPASGTTNYWTFGAEDKNGTNYTNNCLGMLETSLSSSGLVKTYIRALKNTAAVATPVELGVAYDTANNTGYTYAPTPATADNSTKIATTAFVKAQGYLTSQTQLSLTNSGSGNAVTGISVSNHAITVTKGSTFLTSHQSLSNYVTLNSEQNITGTKNLTGFRIYNSGITYNANPSANSFVSMGLCGASLASLSSVTLYVNTDGSKGLMFRLSKYHENSVNSVLSIGISASNVYSVTCYGAIQPGSNNTLSCGTSSRKWTAVYATNATIQTSDEREKESIEPISNSVLDAWDEVQWCQFQMKASIEEKGIDNARIHTGTIAQRIKKIFEKRGLDPFKYGLLCYDEWESEPEVIDENGNVCDSGCPAGNQYAIRYEEALAIEAAYQRRRADRLEERLSALEKKVELLMS